MFDSQHLAADLVESHESSAWILHSRDEQVLAAAGIMIALKAGVALLGFDAVLAPSGSWFAVDANYFPGTDKAVKCGLVCAGVNLGSTGFTGVTDFADELAKMIMLYI